MGLKSKLPGGRAGALLVIGVLVKLVAWLFRNVTGLEVAFVDAIGSLGSLAAIVGLTYLVYRAIMHAKRRLLWRVRRKLILSYIFVGVVPVLLVVAFFLVAAFLFFFNVSSYLVASDIRRVTDDAGLAAQILADDLIRTAPGTERQILERRLAGLKDRYPNASAVIVPTPAQTCDGGAAAGRPAGVDEKEPSKKAGTDEKAGTDKKESKITATAAGEWTHLAPPASLPDWVSCATFEGLLAVAPPSAKKNEGEMGLVVRAVARPTTPRRTFAIVVDIPLDAELASRIRDDTTVKLGRVTYVPPIAGAPAASPISDVRSGAAGLLKRPPDNGPGKRRYPSVALLDWRDWETGRVEKAMLALEMNPRDVYDRISAEQARAGAYSLGLVFLLFMAGLAVLFVIIEGAALVMGVVLAKSITGSVHELFRGTQRVREGDFSHKIAIRTSDQMGELAESFNSMTASIEDLLRQAEEKKRLEEELRIARAIQMSLLPRGKLSTPGLSITALCVPAREVGGDYYDLLPLEHGRLGVLIADVSGKGTSAALYMAELKGLILSLSRIYQSPRQLLIEANRIIASNLDSRSFITMTYAVVDTAAGTMTYARAGHTPLMQRRSDGNGGFEVNVLTPDGLVLGLQIDGGAALFERLLQEETVSLQQGDLFMFYTDGVSEAMNGQSDCFGETRLGEILSEHGDLPAEELRERILREIQAFVGSAPQHDDMTMILLKVEEPIVRKSESPKARTSESQALGLSDFRTA